MNQPYILLDARGLVLQHLHSGTDMSAVTDSLSGRPVNTPGHALHNLITDLILPLLADFRARQIIAVWDGGNYYREALTGGTYKAHRKERQQSPEAAAAVEEAQKAAGILFSNLGITQVRVPTVEADDVIAWLVERLPTNIQIHTVDRDLLQLAAPRADGRFISVCVRRQWPENYSDGNNTVPFEWVALYKSMVGDSSDGYNGVRGFGPAKWQQLVDTYGYENLGILQAAVDGNGFAPLKAAITAEPGQHPLLEKLVAACSEWRLGWQLAKLHPNLVNSRSEKERKFLRPRWTVRVPNASKINALLELHGCRYLIEPLQVYLPQQHLITAEEGVTAEDILADARMLFEQSPFVSIDWETSAPANPAFVEAARGRDVVDMLSSRITGVGITCGRNLEHTFYLSFDHAQTQNLPIELLGQLMDSIPEHLPKVAHNIYFERTVYKSQFGQELANLHDTKIMASHYDEQDSNALKDLSKRILNYDQLRYSDVIEKGMTMRDYSAEHVFQYGADDPLVTAHLYEFLKLQLLLEGTWEFVQEYEFPAVYQISDAYLGGVAIDLQEMEVLAQEDAEIFAAGMARLRSLIKEHQTPEWRQAGIENLFGFERELLDAKVAAGALTREEAAELFAKARLKVEERVTYADPERIEKDVKFSMTAAGLSKVAALLGLPLPPVGADQKPRLTKPDVRPWYEALNAVAVAGKAADFVRLVGESSATLHQKGKDLNDPAREQLQALCIGVLKAAMPDEKRYTLVGSELSLSSPRQMQALLYGMLNLPVRVRNFDISEEREELDLEGAVQANEDAILTAMAMDAPEGTWRREALECLLSAKKADTRRKNFYATYPLWLHPADGVIHPQLNSVGTETRRMSGSAPNVMQMPKRGEGLKFRNCVLPSQGHDLIVSIDWAGEELRVAAGLSLDEEMLSCYIDKTVLGTLPQWMLEALGPRYVDKFQKATLRDIHSLTASGIAKMTYDEFEKARHDETHPRYKELKATRGAAKSVNFLSQYGGGAAKLARKLICTQEIAQSYLDAKKQLYRGFEEWRARTLTELNDVGHLRTLYGSYRHVYSDLFTPDKGLKGHIERSALNSLVQGVCADILKVVLTRLWKAQTFQRYGAQFIAPIHDELVFSCHSRQAPALIMEVHSIMTSHVPHLPCPLWAEPSLGPNFGTQIEIGPFPTEEKILAAIEKALKPRYQHAA